MMGSVLIKEKRSEALIKTLNLINILYHIARPSDKKPQQATILESITLFISGQGVYLV